MVHSIARLGVIAAAAAALATGTTTANADTFARHSSPASVSTDYPIYDPPPCCYHYVPPKCQPSNGHKCPVGVKE